MENPWETKVQEEDSSKTLEKRVTTACLWYNTDARKKLSLFETNSSSSLPYTKLGDVSGTAATLANNCSAACERGHRSHGPHHSFLCPREAAVGQSSETGIGLTAASALAACCQEMNNACSTFKCGVTECFQGENLRLLTLPAWEEHPCSIPCSEGLNLYLHTRRVWVVACPHCPSLWAALQAEGPSWGWGNFSAESCSWHFGWSWKLSLTSEAGCSLEVTRAWCPIRWVDETQHCGELDGVHRVEYLRQIFHSK